MAWSTREVAMLAGTTERAVRYYHQVGLLDEPQRAPNGYKQYGVADLLRVLRIRKLIELGMGVEQVRDLGDLEAHPAEQLRGLDARAREAIARLEDVRTALDDLLAAPRAPIDLPVELARVATSDNTSAQDLRMLAVLGRIMTPDEIDVLSRLVESAPLSEVGDEFGHLPEDASESEREDLARRMLPETRAARERFAGLPESDPGNGERRAFWRAFQDSLEEIYTPAQRDVLARINRMLVRDR